MPRIHATKDCQVCRGKGSIRAKGNDGKFVTLACRRCGGSGKFRIRGGTYDR